MRKATEHYKLSPKARIIAKDQRRQFPPEAFEDRNTKVKISMFIDLDILEYFKARAKDGAPYQTQINAELRKIMESEQSGEVIGKLRQAASLIESAIRIAH